MRRATPEHLSELSGTHALDQQIFYKIPESVQHFTKPLINLKFSLLRQTNNYSSFLLRQRLNLRNMTRKKLKR